MYANALDVVDRRHIAELVGLGDDKRHFIDVEDNFLLVHGVCIRRQRFVGFVGARLHKVMGLFVCPKHGELGGDFDPVRGQAAAAVDAQLRYQRSGKLDRHVLRKVVAIFPGQIKHDVFGNRVCRLLAVKHNLH